MQRPNPFVKKRKPEPSLNTTSTLSTTTQAKDKPNTFFHLVKRQKNEPTPSTSKDTSDSSAKRKFIDTFPETQSTSNSTMEKQKQRKIASSTVASESNLGCNSISVSRIKAEDEQDIPWLYADGNKSKENGQIKNECDESVEDSELKEYIESFRNCVIIRVKNLIAPQKTESVVSNYTGVNTGTKNFKKFKKVRIINTHKRCFILCILLFFIII